MRRRWIGNLLRANLSVTRGQIREVAVLDTEHLIRSALNLTRRNFVQISAATAAVGMAGVGVGAREAQAFAYEPYPKDDDLTTVVTSCAHNCGSRHALIAHKKGDVIVRLSSDDGRYQADGFFGKDTEEEPQLRACLRGRAYRQRLYSAERLLYPMIRVGARGEGKFKRASWDYALDYIIEQIVRLKEMYGPTAILDQSYAGASWGVLHISGDIEGVLGRFRGIFGCRTMAFWLLAYRAAPFSSPSTCGTSVEG